MPRQKGSGNGTLGVREGRWIGRWYRHGIDDATGKLKVTRPEKMLGLVSEVSREDALARLRSIVESERFTKRVSRKMHVLTCNWGAVPSTPDVDAHQRSGAIAEMVVVIDLLRTGYEVFRAVCHSAACDLLAVKGETTARVEVKYIGNAKTTPSTLRWKLARNVGKFDLCALVKADYTIEYIAALEIKERVEKGGLKWATSIKA